MNPYPLPILDHGKIRQLSNREIKNIPTEVYWALQAAAAQIERLHDLIACVADESPCWFDHHGGCQEHGFLSLKAGERCPMGEIQELIAAQGKEQR